MNQQRSVTECHRLPTRYFLIYQSFLLLCSKYFKENIGLYETVDLIVPYIYILQE